MARHAHRIVRTEDRKAYPKNPSCVPAPHLVALCGKTREVGGYDGDYWLPASDDLTSITCPKCAGVEAKRKLAEVCGEDDVKMEPYTPVKGETQPFRSAYGAYVNGDLVGVVVYNAGRRGGAWEVCNLSTMADRPDVVEMGVILEGTQFHSKKDPATGERVDDLDRPYSIRQSFTSKDGALLQAYLWFKAGRLRTATQTKALRREEDARRANYREQREQEAAKDARIEAETIEGLRSILARAESGELALTNFETDAVHNALLLKYKVVAA